MNDQTRRIKNRVEKEEKQTLERREELEKKDFAFQFLIQTLVITQLFNPSDSVFVSIFAPAIEFPSIRFSLQFIFKTGWMSGFSKIKSAIST